MPPPSSDNPVSSPSVHPIEQLLEPFWHFVLPELPAPAIVALSHTSRSLHRVVKDAPCISQSALHAFEAAVPHGLRGQAKDWRHLHSILRTCFGALSEMYNGGPAHVHQLAMEANQQAMGIVWSPVWPSSTVVIPTATMKVAGLEGHKGPTCLGTWVPPYIVSTTALQASTADDTSPATTNDTIADDVSPATTDDVSPATALIWAVWCPDAIHFVALFVEHGGMNIQTAAALLCAQQMGQCSGSCPALAFMAIRYWQIAVSGESFRQQETLCWFLVMIRVDPFSSANCKIFVYERSSKTLWTWLSAMAVSLEP